MTMQCPKCLHTGDFDVVVRVATIEGPEGPRFATDQGAEARPDAKDVMSCPNCHFQGIREDFLNGVAEGECESCGTVWEHAQVRGSDQRELEAGPLGLCGKCHGDVWPLSASESEARIAGRYREAARENLHYDGDVEVDPDAPVSLGDDAGAYVQAWVWVGDLMVDTDQ